MHSFRSHGSCGCGCGRPGSHEYSRHHHHPHEEFAGGFGVRRPLRFLAWKLDLQESQITALASVLNELKTERAQAAVDDRRALATLADAVQGESFDRDKASEGAKLRSQSAERLQQKVVDSLARMHALLEPEQRERLAYLLRTGTLMM
jgi:Spy/CpxP family protein refolding chaperone